MINSLVKKVRALAARVARLEECLGQTTTETTTMATKPARPAKQDEYSFNQYSNAPAGYPTQKQCGEDWYGLFYALDGNGKPVPNMQPGMYAPWGGPYFSCAEGAAGKAASNYTPPPDPIPVYTGPVDPYSLTAENWACYQQNSLGAKAGEIFSSDPNPALAKFTAGDLASATPDCTPFAAWM